MYLRNLIQRRVRVSMHYFSIVLMSTQIRVIWWDEEIFGERVQEILGKLHNNSRCYFRMED